jgi:hypothetical protein
VEGCRGSSEPHAASATSTAAQNVNRCMRVSTQDTRSPTHVQHIRRPK